MIPIQTETTNIKFVLEGCNDLPATLFRLPDGHLEVETCWELTDEDLEHLIKNRRIYLYTMGRTLPPMLLSAESMLILAEKGNTSPNEQEENTNDVETEKGSVTACP